MLIGLVPLIFLIYLTSSLYAERNEKLHLLRNYIDKIDESANITRLIDNLQTERQFSSDFVIQNKGFAELAAQRKETDSIILQLRSGNDSSLKDFEKYSFLYNLALIRNGIDSGRVKADGVMHFFSAAIFRLNTLNAVVPGSDIYLSAVYKDMAAQKLLSEMITYLGIIDANVYNILYTKQYVGETLMGTYPSYEVYNSYEIEFLQKASPAVAASYTKIKTGTELKPTLAYLDQLFRTFKLDSIYTYTQWKDLSFAGTNKLRGLQMNLLQKVESRVNEVYEKEKSARTKMLLFLLLTLVVVISIVFYTIHIINSMLRELKAGALTIANGETGFRFRDMPDDVVGSLAGSISKIDNSNKTLAEAADSIGQGNFDVAVSPRSEKDILGNALVRMKENLHRSTRETEESREEFRQLADFVPQMVWASDPNGNVNYYNKQWYEFTGFEKGEGDQSWLPILHPDDAEKCLLAWYDSVRTGKPFVIEYRFKEKKGGYRWFLGRAVPIRNSEGAIVKWFGTCTDIHEQKINSSKLESLVQQRTQDLERSNDDLRQFAHVASHDLKEPLRKIRIFSTRLKEEFEAAIPERGNGYVDKIQLAAQRMSAMIEGVLNYSLVNNMEEEFESIDLNAVMMEIKQDLELVVQQCNAVISYEPLPAIRGVRVLVYQLFYNLINNALKFSGEGRPNVITITAKKIKGADITGFASAVKGQEYISIAIADKGIGFDQAQAEKMFQIFARLNNKDKYEGTGLGLALCRKIVLRHRGFIAAQGKENEGATFTVYLPA
jgi:PAS domain S-box-containing protein